MSQIKGAEVISGARGEVVRNFAAAQCVKWQSRLNCKFPSGSKALSARWPGAFGFFENSHYRSAQALNLPARVYSVVAIPAEASMTVLDGWHVLVESLGIFAATLVPLESSWEPFSHRTTVT